MKSYKSTDSKGYLQVYRLSLIVGLILLSILAHRFPYFSFDLQISRALQNIHQPLFSLIMNLVTEVGDDLHLEIIVMAATVILFYRGYKLEALKAVVFAVSAAASGTLLKIIVGRPRPASSLVIVQEVLADKSFPSLHVLIFTAFFGYTFYLSLYKVKTLWLRLLIAAGSGFLILTIGLSRVYLGAHWASDTLGGYLLGLLLISFIIAHAKR